MKAFAGWLAVPIALLMSGTALAQNVAISPGSAAVQLNGTSGGNRKDTSCAGFVSSAPNHVVQVTEDSNLEFVLRSTGEPALLIRGASGNEFCVPADKFSNGEVRIPGRWKKGSYSVFVGDRANGKHPYTLSISRS